MGFFSKLRDDFNKSLENYDVEKSMDKLDDATQLASHFTGTGLILDRSRFLF